MVTGQKRYRNEARHALPLGTIPGHTAALAVPALFAAQRAFRPIGLGHAVERGAIAFGKELPHCLGLRIVVVSKSNDADLSHIACRREIQHRPGAAQRVAEGEVCRCLLDANREHALGVIGENLIHDCVRVAERAFRVIVATNRATDSKIDFRVRNTSGFVPFRRREQSPHFGDGRIDEAFGDLRFG
jgi:hypothetical protein